MVEKAANADLPAATKKPKRRWFQYSLRSLMIFVVVVAIASGWFGAKLERARKQKAVVEAFLKNGGSVEYDYDSPAWLRNSLGNDFFSTVVHAKVRSDAGFEHLSRLEHLRTLEIRGSQITDAGLRHLEELTQLQGLSFSTLQVMDGAMKHLRGLSQLKWLRFEGEKYIEGPEKGGMVYPLPPQITDAGLEQVGELRQLRSLIVSGKAVTDAGMEHFKRLNQLEFLELNETLVGDAGLEKLRGLDQLKTLSIFNSRIVTDAGVAKLKRALPNCKIDWQR